MIRINIPCHPVSDNHLYLQKGFRRFMTKKGTMFKELVKKCARKDIIPYTGQVLMEIEVYFGDKRKRDIHGHIKCLADSLEGIAYINDVQVKKIIAEKFYDKEFPRTIVKVIEIETK